MDGGAWWATVHGVAKSRTRLSDFTLLKRTKLLICLKVSPGLITVLQDLDPGTPISLLF